MTLINLENDYQLFKERLVPFRRFQDSLPAPGRDALLIVSGRGMNAPITQLWTYLSITARMHGMRVFAIASRRQEWLNRYYRLLDIQPLYFEDLFEGTARVLPAELADALDAALESPESLRSLTYRGVPIGEIALSTYCRYKGTGIIDLSNPDAHGKIRQWAHLIFSATEVANELIDTHGVSMMWFGETFFEEYGGLYFTAIERNVNIVRFAGAVQDHTMVLQHRDRDHARLHHGGLIPELFEEIKRAPDGGRMVAHASKFFADKYGNAWHRTKRNMLTAKPITLEEARAGLNLPEGRKIAIIFSHILYDTIFFWEDIFKDYATWLVETVRAAIANDKLEWFIKVHPSNIWRGELNVLLGGRYEEEVLIEKHFGALPPHVHIIGADTTINPYLWMQIADIGVTVRGTSGMEMAAMGKTVVTAGYGRYDGNGFTHDPRTAEDYLGVLGQLHDLPPPTPEQTNLAQRYLYGTFLIKQFPLTSLEPKLASGKTRMVSSDDLVYMPTPWNRFEIPEDLKIIADFLKDASRYDLTRKWYEIPLDFWDLKTDLHGNPIDRVGIERALHAHALENAKAGMWDEAIHAWRQASELNPRNVGYVHNIAHGLRTLQRWPEALAAHERLATAVPATPQSLLLLGYVAFQAEEFAKAKAAWDAVLEREPEHKEAQQNMAVLRRQKPWLFPAQAT